MKYFSTIGLEVHVQLRTKSKMFCGCPNAYGAEPNTQVCPVCLGYPGAMPTPNREAVLKTVRTGLMLGCDINRLSKWDRKSYFYPDMPKNYQISQYDQPFCLGGTVNIDVGGQSRSVKLTRIHLEEDVGKNMHFSGASGIDFNRAGTPLMEIVSEPDMSTPAEALAFLQALKEILLCGEISDCNLEEGNLRCDVNCSVRPESQQALGAKTELKNLNTFKGVFHALEYEIQRQTEALKAGETILQETRRWDMDAGCTTSMRTKENAHDYRYFPEPDLMPVRLTDAQIEAWSATLPELPRDRRQRFVTSFGLPEYDAGVLVADKHIADYFEAVLAQGAAPKAASNWLMTEMMRSLAETNRTINDVLLRPDALARLIALVENKTLNMTKAKEVFEVLLKDGGDPEAIVKNRGLAQVSDQGAIETFVDQAIADNPDSVQDFKGGKAAALQFLVGQVMRLSRGKANPQVVGALLRDKLAK
ncbi:MAG: Asp-tRNA(Asn)/Glu-tRNA(Gln) amidotransferase subunit GatB [Verrucomicrobia bacterium]|nr:Asp-tRNA(Asn)/Glu-tRNA(Gln) amidotransferase subunit GatB [Verrucomicrobiota bacterium]